MTTDVNPATDSVMRTTQQLEQQLASKDLLVRNLTAELAASAFKGDPTVAGDPTVPGIIEVARAAAFLTPSVARPVAAVTCLPLALASGSGSSFDAPQQHAPSCIDGVVASSSSGKRRAMPEGRRDESSQEVAELRRKMGEMDRCNQATNREMDRRTAYFLQMQQENDARMRKVEMQQLKQNNLRYVRESHLLTMARTDLLGVCDRGDPSKPDSLAQIAQRVEARDLRIAKTNQERDAAAEKARWAANALADARQALAEKKQGAADAQSELQVVRKFTAGMDATTADPVLSPADDAFRKANEALDAARKIEASAAKDHAAAEEAVAEVQAEWAAATCPEALEELGDERDRLAELLKAVSIGKESERFRLARAQKQKSPTQPDAQRSEPEPALSSGMPPIGPHQPSSQLPQPPAPPPARASTDPEDSMDLSGDPMEYFTEWVAELAEFGHASNAPRRSRRLDAAAQARQESERALVGADAFQPLHTSTLGPDAGKGLQAQRQINKGESFRVEGRFQRFDSREEADQGLEVREKDGFWNYRLPTLRTLRDEETIILCGSLIKGEELAQCAEVQELSHSPRSSYDTRRLLGASPAAPDAPSLSYMFSSTEDSRFNLMNDAGYTSGCTRAEYEARCRANNHARFCWALDETRESGRYRISLAVIFDRECGAGEEAFVTYGAGFWETSFASSDGGSGSDGAADGGAGGDAGGGGGGEWCDDGAPGGSGAEGGDTRSDRSEETTRASEPQPTGSDVNGGMQVEHASHAPAAATPLATIGDGVDVRPSLIDGAGRGLFARGRRFAKGDVITEYAGPRISSDSKRRGRRSMACNADEYEAAGLVVQTHVAHLEPRVLGNTIYIDGDREPSAGRGGGSFANHQDSPNAKLHQAWDGRVVLCAERDIEDGGEIYRSYGAAKDLAFGTHRLTQTTDKDERLTVEKRPVPWGDLHRRGFHVFRTAVSVSDPEAAAVKQLKWDKIFNKVGAKNIPSVGDKTRLQSKTPDTPAVEPFKQRLEQLLREAHLLTCSDGQKKTISDVHALKSVPLEKGVAGEDQPAHADAADAESLRDRKEEDVPLAAILAIEPTGTRLRIRPFGGQWETVELARGDVLIFRYARARPRQLDHPTSHALKSPKSLIRPYPCACTLAEATCATTVWGTRR